MLPTPSNATKYSYYNKDVSLFIEVDTVKDSLVSSIKIINKTDYDIFITGGYFYIHNGFSYTASTVIPRSNIFDLGYEKQSQDYLHIPNDYYKISKHDSITYTCTSSIPKLSKKTTINFDYLNTGKLAKKVIKKNIIHLYENRYQINQFVYLESCSGFRIEIE
jgi:hypothetical protein